MPLDAEQLQKFREVLLEKRGSLVQQVERLAQDAQESTKATENSKSPQFNSAENASDSYEQDFAFMSMESEEELLRKVDRALVRIRENHYGDCEECQQPINPERLEALPWATMCVKCQSLEEQGILKRNQDEDEVDFEIVEDNEAALIAEEKDRS